MRKLFLLALFAAGNIFGQLQTYAPHNYSHLLGMPGFSDALLQMHFKLYEGYVKNANELLLKLSTMGAGQPGSSEYGALKRRLGWEFDGMRLHELYFDNLGGNGTLDPASPLFAAIATQFGSFEKWRRDFIATGSMRGIGWAVLYLDPAAGRLVNVWINEHDVGHLAGGAPILIMDVFEHAYMPQYGLDRAKYIDAFFKNINWKAAESRFPR
jgi:superoxide dismutase, Fe-Mn family